MTMEVNSQEIFDKVLRSLTPKELSSGNAAIILTTILGETEKVRALIESGANVNYETEKHQFCAEKLAAKLGHTDIVRLLLRNKAHYMQHFNNRSSLEEAIRHGHVEIAELLLDRGDQFKSHFSDTRLTLAVKSGSIPMVKLFLNKGDSIQEMTNKDITPLMTAEKLKGQTLIEMLDFLIEMHADVKFSNKADNSAFSHAIHMLNSAMVEHLLAKVDYTQSEKDRFIYLAVLRGDVSSFEILVKAGANCKSQTTTPLLFIAVHQNNKELSVRMIKLGVDINHIYENKTALTLASAAQNLTMIKLLLKNGADINLTPPGGDSPLLHACNNNSSIISMFMFMKGADLNAISKNGTPLIAAITSNHYNVVEWLITFKADVNLTQSQHQTPLMLAIAHGFKSKILHALLDLGASVNIASLDGTTMLDRAKSSCTHDVVARIENLLLDQIHHEAGNSSQVNASKVKIRL